MNKSTEKLLKQLAGEYGYVHVLRRELIEFRAARQLILAGICHEDYEQSTGAYIVLKFGKVKP
jgi:hypothetical protein